ncbi:unannotated protein [freshwater metagenome]|uniref:Unannotated protein n=1 Tax=freshwater metagenome TaxID=449393 RepID=A0A6J7DTW9_9ZZZZ
MAIDRELRHIGLAHQRLEIWPNRICALGKCIIALINYFVQNLHALIRCTDLVGIRVHKHPAHLNGVPIFQGGIKFTTDVLDRLVDQG